MFLDEISNPATIVEASDDYGRKMYFDYRKTEKGKSLLSSPSPIVLYLGTWRMTDKKGNNKKFICGLNLAYLADEGELAAVQHALSDILKSKNMKTRYRIGKTLLPDIFRRAYRTYNVNNVVARPIRGRLYALKPTDDDKEEAKNLASRDGRDWGELGNQERNQYIDQSVRKRGSEDVKRQEKSKKEREQIDRHIQQKEKEKPEPELKKEPEEPSKPVPPPPTPRPAPTKPPQEFKPLELGPGYEEPKPKAEPAIQSPIQSVRTGMATPRKLIIKKPEPEPDREADETQLP